MDTNGRINHIEMMLEQTVGAIATVREFAKETMATEPSCWKPLRSSTPLIRIVDDTIRGQQRPGA